MNALVRIPYDLAWRAATRLAPLVPVSGNKVARTLRARVNLLTKIDAWAGAYRDSSRPLIWVHAASVGESLQALPLLKLLRERNSDAQLVFTFYSPSAEAFVKNFPADFVSYLPFDSESAMRHVVASLRPSVLVFSKLDVWPNLVNEARRAGVRTGIVSATLHSESGRRSHIGAALLGDTYASLDSIGAISDEDRKHIIALGARPSHISVTGDTRYDQVWARSHLPGPVELLDHIGSTRPTIVAGSTWKSDEAHLLPAYGKLRRAFNRLRLVIAPHEPSPAVVTALQQWAEGNKFTCSLLDDPRSGSSDIIIVNRLGVLGDLYAVADIAYVGGGFHRAGLHSVLEPASFGKPVMFGSAFGRTRDALLLIAAGGGASVSNAAGLHHASSGWLADSRSRVAAGAAAQSVVQKGLGAAEASYLLVTNLLELSS